MTRTRDRYVTQRQVLAWTPCWSDAQVTAYFAGRAELRVDDIIADAQLKFEERAWLLGAILVEQSPALALDWMQKILAELPVYLRDRNHHHNEQIAAYPQPSGAHVSCVAYHVAHRRAIGELPGNGDSDKLRLASLSLRWRSTARSSSNGDSDKLRLAFERHAQVVLGRLAAAVEALP